MTQGQRGSANPTTVGLLRIQDACTRPCPRNQRPPKGRTRSRVPRVQREATGVPRGGGAPALARQPPFTRGLRHLKGKLAAAVASTFSVSNSWHIYTGFWSGGGRCLYATVPHLFRLTESHP